MAALIPRLEKLKALIGRCVGLSLGSIREASAYFGGESVGKALGWTAYLLLAIVLPVGAYGEVNIFFTSASIIAPIAGLGVPDAVLRGDFWDSSSKVVTTPVAVVMCGSIVVAAVGWLSSRSLGSLIGVRGAIVLLACIAGGATAIRKTVLSLCKARKRLHLYASVQVLEGSLLLIVAVTVGAVTASSLETAFAVVIGMWGVGIVAVWLLGARWNRRINYKYARRLLVFGGPLIIHLLAIKGLNSIDQLIVNAFIGSEATGSYAFSYRFGMAMQLVNSAVYAVWVPNYIRDSDNGGASTEELFKRAKGWFRLIICASVLVVGVTVPIAITIGGGKYENVPTILPMVVFGYVWYGIYALACGPLLERNESNTIALSGVIALVVNIAANIYAVDAWGIVGVAAVSVVSFALMTVVVIGCLRPRERSALIKNIWAEVVAVCSFFLVLLYLQLI